MTFARKLSPLLCFLLLTLTVHAEERLAVPDNLFFYAPAASVVGPEAVWNNPAALARFKPASFALLADYFDGHYLKSWGTAGSKEGLGTAYRRIDNPGGDDIQELLWGAGLGLGRTMSFGGSYRHFSAGPEAFHKRHLWNIGLTMQSGPSLMFGAVLNNMNKGKVDGERTQMEQRYSVAYRPFQEKATFAVDMFLGDKQNMSEATFHYFAEVRPIAGLYLSGGIDSDKNYEIGARVNLRRYFIGGQGKFNRSGNERGTTTYVGMTTARQPSIIPYEQRRVTMSMSGGVQENPPQPIFGRKEIPYATMLVSLYRAVDDATVQGLVLNLDNPQLGFAQAQELRDAIKALRAVGKKVIVHLGYPTNLTYYIATAADSIYLPPVSQLNLVGLRAELTFYAGTLEKLGVKADLMRIGDYKSATESFTNREASEANKEQINRLLDNLFDQLVTAISEGRGLSTDSVKALIDKGPLNCQEALQAGLADKLVYRRDMMDSLSSTIKLVSLRKYIDDTIATDSWVPKPVIAVVVAEGDIGGTPVDEVPFQPSSAVTPGSMRYAFYDALRNPQVKGILFRINSPGGVAIAGEDIWETANRSAQEKPTVVSMGNLAASGGYYIAMVSPTIIASPGTITGSIGIFGGKLDMSSLYKKIELNKELYQRGKFSAMLTSARPFTDDERKQYYKGLSDFYQHFISLVGESRELKPDSVDALGRGQVWTGSEALHNGLVDGVGGMKEALDQLKDKIGLASYGIELYPRVRPWLQLPMPSFFSSISDKIFGHHQSQAAATLLSSDNGIMFTRMPYDISIE